MESKIDAVNITVGMKFNKPSEYKVVNFEYDVNRFEFEIVRDDSTITRYVIEPKNKRSIKVTVEREDERDI